MEHFLAIFLQHSDENITIINNEYLNTLNHIFSI